MFKRSDIGAICTATLLILVVVGNTFAQTVQPPKPYGALPSKQQVKWHEMEMYAFVHFTINTFTDKEWGFGDEDPKLFNPTAFDAEKIVLDYKAAGLEGLILTAKHHDGFCLWPTKTTEHNITKSPWKNGKGDMVREFADACKKHGLKFGIYLSPWDRNNTHYGTQEYVNIYREQYKELLTQYGPVFETWHDGANGGDGHYAGARESRQIDRTTYYNWPLTWSMEKQWQPDAVIMSDVGPDIRWVGTERGYAGDPCWHTYTPHAVRPGTEPGPGEVKDQEGMNGHRDGKFWMPAEVNFSIRPGWFFHAHENDKVKTGRALLNHYFQSVGRGTTMLLNVPPDRRGLVYEKDAESLRELGKLVKELFSVDHSKGAKVTASNVRANNNAYAASKVLDNDRYSYWGTDDNVTTGSITLQLTGKKTFNIIRLRENIKLGQRIDDWAVDVWENNEWREYQKGSAIGVNRLVRGNYITTDRVRIRITKAAASICLSEVGLFTEQQGAPGLTIGRNRNGEVEIVTESPVAEVRYTTDRTEPNRSSTLYTLPFAHRDGVVIRAKSFDIAGKASPTFERNMGPAKNTWKVVATSANGDYTDVNYAIDDNPNTIWHTWKEKNSLGAPQDISIDMGTVISLKGFTYMPRQDLKEWALVDQYSFMISVDGEDWKEVSSGEFSNIKANPIEQRILLNAAVQARYFKFVARRTVPVNDGLNYVAVAELGIIQ